MRWLLGINLILAVAAGAWAGPEARPEVGAARNSAVERLRIEIESESITPSLTVEIFLAQNAARRRLQSLLHDQAQQIGGPRWLDGQTCQLRLDIPAPAIRRELARIAAENPQTTSVSSDELVRDLQSWDTRVFSATGTSTGAIETIRPPPGLVGWNDVSPADIRRAIEAAKQDAATHILDSIAPVSLAPDKQISDALGDKQINDELTQWIESCPITLVDFAPDHQVNVTLNLLPSDLTAKLRSILGPRTDIPHPYSEPSWSAMENAIARQLATATGSGRVAAARRGAGVEMPAEPPDWVGQQLDAQGRGSGNGRLRAARAAEAAASDALRTSIDKLPIGEGKTLGDAAAQNEQLSKAIDRSIAIHAQVYKIDYESDNTVSVRMSLDLRRLWEGISPRP
ncbi:MAG: hypothetical protein M3O30_11390 [Planctomycetota bacterium]|nr:hypothetical protein [Planctomycetota bacterium]